MSVQTAAVRTRGSRAELRQRADHARAQLAHMTLWFPVAGSVLILIRPQIASLLRVEVSPTPRQLAAALIQLWGLYGPYLVAITAYLWTQKKVATSAEKAPNGWQMSMLAHSLTKRIIVLVYVVPLLIYAIIFPLQTANYWMAIYQSAVHTFTAAAITYFFARPEEDAPTPAKG